MNCIIWIFSGILRLLVGCVCVRSECCCLRVLGMLSLLISFVYLRHSVIMWLTDSSVPQVEHIGISSFSIINPCVRRACPIRSLLIITFFSSVRTEFGQPKMEILILLSLMFCLRECDCHLIRIISLIWFFISAKVFMFTSGKSVDFLAGYLIYLFVSFYIAVSWTQIGVIY